LPWERALCTAPLLLLLSPQHELKVVQPLVLRTVLMQEHSQALQRSMRQLVSTAADPWRTMTRGVTTGAVTTKAQRPP